MVITYLRRAYSSFATYVFDIPSRLLAFLLFLLLLLLPITKPTTYILLVMTIASNMAVFAASWDLLVGRAGQMSLGHALFFGIGAYVTALLYTHMGLPLWVTIPLGVLVGVSVAVLLGFPCLRVKGPYLALVTMAFPIILISIIFYFRQWTGGERGIYPLPRFFPFLTIYQQQVAEYYFTLLLLLVSSIILYTVANSKTGIVFVSIGDDELASKECGINVTKYKLMAFAISGLFASLAGSINAHVLKSTGTATLEITLSFMPVIITILGGIGTIYGPIAGAYLIYILDMYVLEKIVTIPPEWGPARYLIYIVVVVILIIKWPRGIARFVTDKLEDLQEERELEERGKWIWKRKKKRRSNLVHEG